MCVCLAIPVLIARTHASTGVIVIRPDQIVVAADSKMVSITRSGRKFPASPTCKIGALNNFAWVVTGTRSPEFQPTDLARRAASAPGNFSDKVAFFVKSAKEQLNGVLWPKEIAQIGMVAFHDGRAQLSIRAFVGTDDGRGVMMPPGGQSDCSDCASLVTQIASKRAFKAMTENRSLFDEASPVHLAIQLVTREIKDSPDEVGPPISLLVLTPKGVEWEEKGLCR
jgi:hypothetical protein